MFIVVVIMFVVIILLLLVLLVKRPTAASSEPPQVHARLDVFQGRLATLQNGQERIERSVRDEIAQSRDEITKSSRGQREEMAGALKGFGDSVLSRMGETSNAQKMQLESVTNQFEKLIISNEMKLNAVKSTIDANLKNIQNDNSTKLEQMRATVEEKLQGTLERQLGESFKQVSDRLEQVHKGLGEMQMLAVGVGDLKKVLINVKIRGIWGEIQLGNLLEQILTPEQYDQNVITKKGSKEFVEFAIKLPGRDQLKSEIVWLPIDAKFPLEDYQRLEEARENADTVQMEKSGKSLESQIKNLAKDIQNKYISPPDTTDFGIMYLPTEGLFAEVVRRPGLSDEIQRKYHVSLAGPTTLAALLNSLQMGFRTLAIEKRSSEVWKVLGAVKTEFGKFGEVLEKIHKKLDEATNTIVDATGRSRQIEKKLRTVAEIPVNESQKLLPSD